MTMEELFEGSGFTVELPAPVPIPAAPTPPFAVTLPPSMVMVLYKPGVPPPELPPPMPAALLPPVAIIVPPLIVILPQFLSTLVVPLHAPPIPAACAAPIAFNVPEVSKSPSALLIVRLDLFSFVIKNVAEIHTNSYLQI